jgi:hypothetical protein
MALTISRAPGTHDVQIGGLRVHSRNVTFDASYPTGGEPLAPADVGLEAIIQVLGDVAVATAGTSAVNVAYSYGGSAQTLRAFETAGTVDLAHKEVTSTADLSTYTARLTFLGR